VVARSFVPIELLGRLPATAEPVPAPGAEPAPKPPPLVIPEPGEDWSERTSLFGDGDR
jgi:hypothetical protein